MNVCTLHSLISRKRVNFTIPDVGVESYILLVFLSTQNTIHSSLWQPFFYILLQRQNLYEKSCINSIENFQRIDTFAYQKITNRHQQQSGAES